MKAVVGFVPLVDCATLVVAANKGFAAAEGLELTLIRESSWANIRDRLLVGHFDAAHMLGPMAIASSLGIGHLQIPLIAPLALGLGGNAITLSTKLWSEVEHEGGVLDGEVGIQGHALRRALQQRRVRREPTCTFAMVYPFSAHHYELRYWLAASGIDPDHDVRLVVLPPPLLVDALREGQIDGFCVGEPWSSSAVDAGVGRIVVTSTAIWRASPEKVLGLRAQWAEQQPQTVAALIRALYRAALWCDEPDHRAELARLLAEPQFIGTSADLIERALAGNLRLAANTPAVANPGFLSFAKYAATFPWKSHALWFYSQMVRWGQIGASAANEAIAAGTFRPDLYRSALAPLGVDAPATDLKREIFSDTAVAVPSQQGTLSVGVQGFFDRREFDPAQLQAYLGTFTVT